MPIYEYKGQQYELSTDDPSVAKQKILSYLGKQEAPAQESSKWYEDIGAGLRGAGETAKTGLDLAAGGLAGVFGDTQGQEEIFADLTARRAVEKEREAGINRGEGGKVLKAVGAIPAYLNPVTAGLMLSGGAAETGTQLVEEGASSGTALAGAGADLASSSLMFGLGPLTNVAGRVANAGVQAGINVGQEALINHPVQNAIREQAGLQDLPAMTPGDYGAAAVPGAAFGAISAKPRAAKAPVADDTAPISPASLQGDFVANRSGVIDAIVRQEEALLVKMASVADSGGERGMTEKARNYYLALEEQYKAKVAERKALEQKVAANKEPLPPTDEAEAIRNVDVGIPEKVGAGETAIEDRFVGDISPEALYRQLASKQKLSQERVAPRDEEYSTENIINRFKKEEPTPRSINEIAKELQDADSRHTTMIQKGEYGQAKLVAREVNFLKKEFFQAKKARKQRGSWIPFDDGGEPRPDDSNAPGVMEPWRISDDAPPYEKIRSQVAQEWKQGKNESYDSYQLRLDRIAEAKYAKEETMRKQQPTENDILKSGIRTPGKAEKVVRPILQGFKPGESIAKLERELGKARTQHDAIQRRVANDEKARSGETVLGKEMEGTTPTRREGRGFVEFTNDAERAASLLDKIGRLEEAVAKAKATRNRLAAVGNAAAIKATQVKGTGRWAAKDSVDPHTDKTDSVFATVEDEVYQELRNRGRTEAQAAEAAAIARELDNLRSDLLKTEDRSYQQKLRAEIKKAEAQLKAARAIKADPNQRGMWKPFEIFKKDVEEDMSDATAAARAVAARKNEIATTIDVSNLRPADEVLQQLKDTQEDGTGGRLSKIERELFGNPQWIESIKRKNPILWEVYKWNKKAQDLEIALKRKWWAGDASAEKPRGLAVFRTLKHYKDMNTLSEAIPQMKPMDRVAVAEFMIEHAKKLADPKTIDVSGLTPEQLKVYQLARKFLDQINADTKSKYRYSYIPHMDKGDFAVGIKVSTGDLVHLEYFPTKAIADKWASDFKAKGFNTTDTFDTKSEGSSLSDSANTIREIIGRMNEKTPRRGEAVQKEIDKALNYVAEHTSVGGHNLKQSRVSGFIGTKLGKTRQQNADEFFKSLEHYATERAAQHRKSEIIRSKTEFWESEAGRELAAKFPNQKASADYLDEVAMNTQQKYGFAVEVDKVRDVVDNLFSGGYQQYNKRVNQLIDTLPESVRPKKLEADPYYYPDVPVLDRTLGMFGQLFYIKALTSRLSFQAGQVLTSVFSFRQFFKEGTFVDAMRANGQAWDAILRKNDPDFEQFTKEMANTTDSLKPQFKNEINEFPLIDEKHHDKLAKVFGVASGQTQSAMGDSFSRYVTMARAYYFYKDMGFKGAELKANVSNLVDNTMIMYGRPSTPAVFNRSGLLGQTVAPLQKFGLGQLQNLIGDMKYMVEQPGAKAKLKASLPALSTMLTVMITAGTTGIPLLLEYEAIRYTIVSALNAVGLEEWADMLPGSVIESMLKNDNTLTQAAQGLYEGLGASEDFAKDAATHGVVSAATGYDIGSSLRFNPYIPGTDEGKPLSLLDGLPVIKSMVDMANFAGVHIKELAGGDVTEAEERKADMSQQMFMGQKYLVDKLKYGADDRDWVPGGGRGYGQVEQTKEEQIAQLLGTSTLSTARARVEGQIGQRNDKKLAANRQKATDLLLDGLEAGNQDDINRAIDLAIRYEMTPSQIRDALKAGHRNRNSDAIIRRFTNQKGVVSSQEQMRKYREHQAYE